MEPMEQPVEEQPPVSQEQIAEEVQELKKDLHTRWLNGVNIAEVLDEKRRNEIGERVKKDYDLDWDSLSDWREINKEALNLARQIKDNRTFAGQAAADVKLPLISVACIQYAAREYSEIIKGNQCVRYRVIGKDEGGEKAARGQRICTHMNYQLMGRNSKWEDNMDSMGIIKPLIGVAFKKTFRNNSDKNNESVFIYPEDLVVNYSATSFEPRATHKIYLYPNEIRERINRGEFIDFEYDEAAPDRTDEDTRDKSGYNQDENAPHLFLEQHRWLDLDDDGYEEPYIVMVHNENSTCVRITPRWAAEDAEYDEKGNVIAIKPYQFFTKFPFLRAMDGCFYEMGFGMLLSPICHSANTLMNQIIDGGTAAAKPSGFYGTGLKFGKKGNITVGYGEWKPVNAAPGELSKNIFQFPFNGPSDVLFSTLGMVVQMANKLASMSDMMSGEMPQGDAKPTTVLALLKEGRRVYSSIHKRTFRALNDEFAKLRRLNRIYATEIQDEYSRIMDEDVNAYNDYKTTDIDIITVSTEEAASDYEKYMKAEAMMAKLGSGLDDQEIVKFWAEAMNIEDYERFLPKGPPPPDPQLELETRKVAVLEREVFIKELEFLSENEERQQKVLKIWAETVKKLAEAKSENYQQSLDGLAKYIHERATQLLNVGGILRDTVQQGAVQQLEGAPGNAAVLPQNAGMGGGMPAAIGGGGMAPEAGPAQGGYEAPVDEGSLG